jgi:hypothetical protein
VLIRAGSLAFWLAARLFRVIRKMFLLDLGRALDAFFPKSALRHGWFTSNRTAIVQNMRRQHLYP